MQRNVVRTPTVLQMESLECGAAALAIILGYHGRNEPLEQLRVRCGVGRDGAKVSNLLRAARSFGMQATAWSTEAAELPKLKMPVMVFWNFNHFVVVEGFADGMVHLNDPASGRRQVRADDFAAAFTGVLTFEPGADFKTGGATGGLLRAMFERMASDRPALLFAALAGLFMVVPGMVIPVFTRLFVDRILIDSQMGWFLPILLGLFLSTMLEAGLAGCRATICCGCSTSWRWPRRAAISGTSCTCRCCIFPARAGRGGLAPGPQRVGGQGGVGRLGAGADQRRPGLLLRRRDADLRRAADLHQRTMVCASMAAFRYAAKRTQELSISYAIADGRLRGNASNGIAMLETLQAGADDSHFYTRPHGAAGAGGQRQPAHGDRAPCTARCRPA